MFLTERTELLHLRVEERLQDKQEAVISGTEPVTPVQNLQPASYQNLRVHGVQTDGVLLQLLQMIRYTAFKPLQQRQPEHTHTHQQHARDDGQVWAELVVVGGGRCGVRLTCAGGQP